MTQTKLWLLLTYVLTAFTCFSSLYYFKYLPYSKSLSTIEHLRLDYFRQGGAWDNAYRDSPQAIAKERLNLNAWGGFHELKINKFFPPKKINLSYDVFLTKNSYVYLYLDRSNEENSIGIRLSLNNEYPSIFFRRNGKGKFLEKQNIKTQNKVGKNRFEALYEYPKIIVKVNQKEVISFDAKKYFEKEFVFAWGGSSEETPVSIDNIVILNEEGKSIYRNDFSLTANEIQYLDIAAVIGIMFFIVFLTRIIRDEKLQVSVSFCFFLFFLGGGLLYHFYLSAEYIEGEEEGINRAQVRTIIRDKINRFEHESSKGSKKIFFYGGSKTVGVGARVKEETWVKLLENKVRSIGWTVHNFGVVSADTEDILFLHSRLRKYNPELIVILSGVNDHDSNIYKSNLDKIFELNPKQEFLVVQESTYINSLADSDSQNSIRNFYAIKEHCLKINIECIKMDEVLYRGSNKLYDSGILWVEWVHNNSYGQEVMAQIIDPILEKKIREL